MTSGRLHCYVLCKILETEEFRLRKEIPVEDRINIRCKILTGNNDEIIHEIHKSELVQ